MIDIIEGCDIADFLEGLRARRSQSAEAVEAVVREIIRAVRDEGDKALFRYTKKLDGACIDTAEVPRQEIKAAAGRVDKKLILTMQQAWENILNFHERQIVKGMCYKKEGQDIVLGRMVNPIPSVGIYVPGGKAAYPSTVLMNAGPAKIAGVQSIVMVTPPDQNGRVPDVILAAADVAEVDRVFRIGGAQAVAALAFGTETVPPVCKITGPGNAYVAAAKRCLAGEVGTDMTAGPSEVLIIADNTADPVCVALDMAAQAEHDEMASAVLLTEYPALAASVANELVRLTATMERRSIIEKSITRYGGIIITKSQQEAVDLANEMAPEHLELLTANCFDIYRQIKNAGAIFLGQYAPVPLGDYWAGPNHTLPTCGTARYASALSVENFIKKTSVVYYGKKALWDCCEDVARFAESEGLAAHAESVRCRFRFDDMNVGGYSFD